MAGAKKQTPPPIDRPLSRAYLREFSGWSTAFPPGVSEPTSLRIMENILINRDGTARIRPGLRALTTNSTRTAGATSEKLCSSFEAFYLADGTRAWLVAQRNVGTGEVRIRGTFHDALTDTYPIASLLVAPFSFDASDWTAFGGEPYFTSDTSYVRFLQIDNKVLALSDNGEPAIILSVGATKKIHRTVAIPDPTTASAATPNLTMFPLQPTGQWIMGPQTSSPMSMGQTVLGGMDTLLDRSSSGSSPYNMLIFCTFSNAFGESEPSPARTFSIKLPFGSWRWFEPANSATAPAPTTTATSDVTRTCDQLFILPDADWFNDAKSAFATHMNLYGATWSASGVVPVEAVLLQSKEINPSMTYVNHGYFHLRPNDVGLGVASLLPGSTDFQNTTAPPTAGQGLVAADRVVLVNDPSNPARISWSSNQSSQYLNFANVYGGGYKTLTSGNMYVPACVKLWQNPESKDTLTVLCRGADGYSTSYYMAPAQVASQSEAVNIMGFEETTATPGTTSPYGCEVANNALYHPLDDQLMKSTANNYNISHKSQTDQIANMWAKLINKHRIVSCFFDQRLYFLVHNPDGEELTSYNRGNEVWVFDLGAEGGTWSRWCVQGVSLRKIEVDGVVYLALVQPEGIFYFDESAWQDETIDPLTLGLSQQQFGWKLETNTQGANRAHDAWAHLQQVTVSLGFFQGEMKYGIRGKDVRGMPVEVVKVVADYDTPGELAFDLEDHLLVRRDMKEWFFFAEAQEPNHGVRPMSFGQINSVQYRYTPSTVNTGYEYGSVETFEYAGGSNLYATNGVPTPYIDTDRP